jgi:hypothetical protein
MTRTDDPVRDAEKYYSDLEDTPRRTYRATITMLIEIECEGTCSEDAKDDADIMGHSLASLISSLDGIIDTDVDGIKVEED